MVDSIFSAMKKLGSSVHTENKVVIDYSGRRILELIGGSPCCGKTTLAPNAYEIDKKEIVQERIKQYINLSSMESLRNEVTSNITDMCPNSENPTVNNEPEPVEELADVKYLKKTKTDLAEKTYEELEQIVELDMQHSVPLIQVIDTFTERKYLDPYLELAIKHGYEVVIKYPKLLMYYNVPKNSNATINDEIAYLQLLNSKKLKPVPKDKMYEMCLNSLSVRQWINNIKHKNGTSPEKWRQDVQPFMKVKTSKKYKDEVEFDSDVKVKNA